MLKRYFSMTFVKNELGNKMGDGLLYDCLATFVDQDSFLQGNDEDIIKQYYGH